MESPDTVSPQSQDNKSKKKHISFGDVIVRNNSLLHPTDTSPLSTTVTPTKKSRFVIEETATSSTVTSENATEEESLDNSSEVIRGRFYVNQQANKQLNDNNDDELNSNNNTNTIPDTDRKSRFEISSAVPLAPKELPIPLTRESSSRSYMRYNSPPPDLIPLTSENIALLTESSRKIGRFELTSSNASSVDVTPRGSVSSSDPTTDQIEELIRMNESQRVLLQEICANYKKPQDITHNTTLEK